MANEKDYLKEQPKKRTISAEMEDLDFREQEFRNIMLGAKAKEQRLGKIGPRLMATLSGNTVRLNNDRAKARSDAENARRLIESIEGRRSELRDIMHNAKKANTSAESWVERAKVERARWIREKESRQALERFHAEQRKAEENRTKIGQMRDNLRRRRR